MRDKTGGGRPLNVLVDNLLLVTLLEGHAAWLREHPRTGWHDYLRMVWGGGVEAIAQEMKASRELESVIEGERI